MRSSRNGPSTLSTCLLRRALHSRKTTNPGTDFIGKVSVEALLHSLTGQLQNLLSNRDFQSLEIQIGDRLAPHQGLNLLNDVDGQQIAEEVFFLPRTQGQLPGPAVGHYRFAH